VVQENGPTNREQKFDSSQGHSFERSYMKPFTDIGQFRDVIRAVKTHHDFVGKDETDTPIYRHETPYPTLMFKGTIKLHGTNSGIVKYKDGHYEYQSRERVLELGKDNSCFMLNMSNCDIDKLFEGIEFNDHCAIYGEYAGNGIQSGIAISQLPKMWVIFAVKIDDVYQNMQNYRHLKNEEQRIFNIYQFEYYTLNIDFNEPEIAQNKLVELTLKVEEQCPVGKHFGVNGYGEGICWEYLDENTRYIFKVKGEKHQNSKVKKLATVDVEAVNSMKEFVEYAVTENRMKQGIDKMKELGIPFEMASTGKYLKWLHDDVIKEETDTIIKNSIDVKKLGSFINNKAKQYWFKYLDSVYHVM
jgi:hypothetical protein